MLAYYLHLLTPEIFRIGPLAPRWYGFAYLLGFVAAYYLLRHLIRIQKLRIPEQKLGDLVLFCCITGVLIGGRLGYVVFYKPNLLTEFTSDFPFWGVLKINQGGMSAHGGVVGSILAIIYYCRRNKLPVINVGDCACMVVPVGLFTGRIANFINGELYGHPTQVPWAVQFPSELYSPTNGNFDVPDSKVNAMLTAVADHANAASMSIEKVISLARHGDTFAQQQLAAILPARHPSQLYEALLEGLLLFTVTWTIGRLTKKDGMAASAFLVGYPIMRIIGEQFRVGDTVKNYLGIPMSLGILYSLLMLVPAVIFWIYHLRKPPAPGPLP